MVNHPTIFVLFAMANTLFFAVTFWNYPRGSYMSNRMLACIYFTFFICWSSDLLDYPHDTIKYKLFFFVKSFYLLIGPLAYHFIKIETTANFKFSQKSLIHLAPLAFVYTFSTIMFLLNHNLEPATHPIPFQFIWFLYQSQALVYIFLTLRQIKTYNSQVQSFLSNSSNYTLDWLKYMIWGFTFIWIIWVLPNFIPSVLLFKSFYPCFIFGLYIIAYSALQRTNPFESLKDSSEEEIKKILNVQYDEKNNTIDPQIEDFKPSLIKFMSTQKPYLDPELNLPKLASLLNVSTHFLSKVINKGMNENFFLFINRYRVEESKKLLIDPNKQHYNILQIAFDSGFNSKTTFNTVFKKMTGMSPSEFQKENS